MVATLTPAAPPGMRSRPGGSVRLSRSQSGCSQSRIRDVPQISRDKPDRLRYPSGGSSTGVLDGKDFVVSGPFVRHRKRLIRFLYIVSLALRGPSPPSGGDGARTGKLPNMHGVPIRRPAHGRPSSLAGIGSFVSLSAVAALRIAHTAGGYVIAHSPQAPPKPLGELMTRAPQPRL